jgi:hypothetical protein
MYDVIYAAEIALCNINKLPLQLKSMHVMITLTRAKENSLLKTIGVNRV